MLILRGEEFTPGSTSACLSGSATPHNLFYFSARSGLAPHIASLWSISSDPLRATMLQLSQIQPCIWISSVPPNSLHSFAWAKKNRKENTVFSLLSSQLGQQINLQSWVWSYQSHVLRSIYGDMALFCSLSPPLSYLEGIYIHIMCWSEEIFSISYCTQYIKQQLYCCFIPLWIQCAVGVHRERGIQFGCSQYAYSCAVLIVAGIYSNLCWGNSSDTDLFSLTQRCRRSFL